MITHPHSLLLDSEALSALALGDRRMQVWAEVARRTDSILYASTVTLAETTDGSPRDNRVRQAAKAIRLIPVSDDIGYRAGALRAPASARRRKARELTVDAIAAATAASLTPPVVVLTSDVADIELILEGTAVRVERIE